MIHCAVQQKVTQHCKLTILQLKKNRVSPVAQLVKKPPTVQETWVQSLGLEDPLEKEKATYSSILAWGVTVHVVARVRQDLVTIPPSIKKITILSH